MSLNNRLVAELIRQRMGWPDDSQAARVINLIPEALKAFGRSYAADPYTRPLVTTPKATTTIPIGARGQVNLATGYDTYQFLLEYLDKGLMYFLPGVTAMPYLLSGGSYASGYWRFLVNPQHDETIAVNGVTFTFKIPDAVVTTAGWVGARGSYSFTGEYYNNKPVFTFNDWYLQYQEGYWYLTDESRVDAAYGAANITTAAYPWDVPEWVTLPDGIDPPPVITKGSLTSVQVEIGETLAETAFNFATVLNASTNPLITVATYFNAGLNDPPTNLVTGTYDTQGTGGNAFTTGSLPNTAPIETNGATFTGGAATAYRLAIAASTNYFTSLSRVRFTTTGSLPTGISASTDYYLRRYTIDGDTATFGLSTTADGQTPVTISTAGSGVLTMTLQDSNDDIPIQLVSPQQAPLHQYLSDVFNYAFIQSSTLTVLPIDDVYPTGSVAFSVPSFPATLSDLPDSEESEKEFLQILANMVGVPVQAT